jgi:hypothetical protein
MIETYKEKVKQYIEEHLKYGFITCVNDEKLPFCLLCQQSLTNESKKRGRLAAHLKAKHGEYVDAELCFFENLKEKFDKRITIKFFFAPKNSAIFRLMEASCEIFFDC